MFHFNREARRPNKIIPCRWAGHVNSEKGGLRAKDGTVGEWQHAGQGVQETRIPDSVLRITRHKARGIETEHPAVFPVALPEFLMRAYADEGDVVFEPFGGAGTSIIGGQRTGRRVRRRWASNAARLDRALQRGWCRCAGNAHIARKTAPADAEPGRGAVQDSGERPGPG